ncbi:hypothetical protein DSM112329_01969 [Paraconexibacter sp. AEG42_29]|uniref:PPM-type phosphatase domain-containing protein n=1 Tax=Paraconexibacter sp. AEG42_29 TaxID=2997339 RepID=A0AAU7ATZ7_9ACTN
MPSGPPPDPTGRRSLDDAAIARLLTGFLRRTHLSTPADVARVTAEQGAEIGATDVEVYLIDYAQEVLVALPQSGRLTPPPLAVAGTVAGRAFSSSTILTTAAEAPDRCRLWVPLLDGTERMGVLAMSFAEQLTGDLLTETCERYAHLVAATVMTKDAYGDSFEFARRQAPMSLAAELVWGLAPPMMFATDDLALAGMLEPAYDNGGDVVDYAVNDRLLHLAMFDAMGHGLAAAGAAAFALAAYRHSRRSGHDLTQTHAAMNQAVEDQYPDRRFVTAVVAELDLDSGRLRYFLAGHPPPFIVRGSRHVVTPPAVGVPPLGSGLPHRAPAIQEVALQPGDVLFLYSDGLTEARDGDGELFTLERLTDFVIREAQAGHPAPEMLRRIRTTILSGGHVELRDDASALLAEWRRGSEARLLPQTVLE